MSKLVLLNLRMTQESMHWNKNERMRGCKVSMVFTNIVLNMIMMVKCFYIYFSHWKLHFFIEATDVKRTNSFLILQLLLFDFVIPSHWISLLDVFFIWYFYKFILFQINGLSIFNWFNRFLQRFWELILSYF